MCVCVCVRERESVFVYELDRVEWYLPLVCTTPLFLRPQHGIHLPVECCDHVVSCRRVILSSPQCLKPLAPHIGDFVFLCICFVHVLNRDRFNRSVRHTMELLHLQLLTEVTIYSFIYLLFTAFMMHTVFAKYIRVWGVQGIRVWGVQGGIF
jgi:hypothetical protein